MHVRLACINQIKEEMKKLIKSIADLFLGVFMPLLRIAFGIIAGTIGGLIQSISDEKRANFESVNGGIGRPNWFRIVGYLVFISLTTYFILTIF